jgi:hypothetical protein
MASSTCLAGTRAAKGPSGHQRGEDHMKLKRTDGYNLKLQSPTYSLVFRSWNA